VKRFFLALTIVLVVAVPSVFSQVRFEIGANAPLGNGYLSGSASYFSDFTKTIKDAGLIPIPNAGLFLQGSLGSVKLGLGVRAYSILIFSAAYPSALAELNLGPVSIEAGFGGYYFGYYAIGNYFGFKQLDILLPELSVWFALGPSRNLRIGAGAIGAFQSNFDFGEVPFVYYAGLKLVLE
jgi:hypothetical protein